MKQDVDLNQDGVLFSDANAKFETVLNLYPSYYGRLFAACCIPLAIMGKMTLLM